MPVNMKPQNSMLTEKRNNEDTSSMQMNTILIEMEHNNNMMINEMSASTLAKPGGSWTCRKRCKINNSAIKRCNKPCFHGIPNSKESDH